MENLNVTVHECFTDERFSQTFFIWIRIKRRTQTIEKALFVGQRVASTQRLSFERVNQRATTAATSALVYYAAYPEICLRKVSFASPQQICVALFTPQPTQGGVDFLNRPLAAHVHFLLLCAS